MVCPNIKFFVSKSKLFSLLNLYSTVTMYRCNILRLLFVLAREHSLLRMFLNIWREIWFPEDPHDASLYNFCTIEFGTFDCPRITRCIRLDCFNGSIYSQPVHTMQSDVAKISKRILFVLTVVYKQCYDK